MSKGPPLSNIMQQQYPLRPSLQPQKPAMPQPQPSPFSNMLPLMQQEQHLSQVLPDGQSAQQKQPPFAETRERMEVEPEQKRMRPTEPSALSAINVVPNDSLREIFKCIHDPASIVRAALVCKKWCSFCSEQEVLDGISKHQPRHLLGYFAMLEEGEMEFFMLKEDPEQAGVPRFLSISFPPSILQAADRRSCVLEETPELACVGRFLCATFPQGACDAMDYRSGRVLVKIGHSLAICDPFRQEVSILPPLLRLPFWSGDVAGEYFLLMEDGHSALHVTVTWMKFGTLGVDIACVNGDQWMLGSNSLEIDQEYTNNNPFCHPAIVVNGCIFLLTVEGFLIEVRLEDFNISVIDLPPEACHQWGSHQLCRAQGKDLIYAHADGFNIQIWIYNHHSWTYCNTIDLPVVFASSKLSWPAIDWDETRSGWGEVVPIYGVGDVAEFMFLGVSGDDGLYLLDIASSTVVKVGEKCSEDKGELIGNRLIPFITSCSPFFPETRGSKIGIKTLENSVLEGNKMVIHQLLATSLDEQSVKNFIKVRYPSLTNLIWDIDDYLTVLHSFAVARLTVEGGPELQHRIDSCLRLTQEWENYIIQTKSLRKKVTSINGVYFQAEVNGQTVTWRAPLRRDYVGCILSPNLLMFYELCIELLLESVKNTDGGFSKKRDAQVLLPNFRYSKTSKWLRGLCQKK